MNSLYTIPQLIVIWLLLHNFLVPKYFIQILIVRILIMSPKFAERMKLETVSFSKFIIWSFQLLCIFGQVFCSVFVIFSIASILCFQYHTTPSFSMFLAWLRAWCLSSQAITTPLLLERKADGCKLHSSHKGLTEFYFYLTLALYLYIFSRSQKLDNMFQGFLW